VVAVGLVDFPLDETNNGMALKPTRSRDLGLDVGENLLGRQH
jgi:hypothetical protein